MPKKSTLEFDYSCEEERIAGNDYSLKFFN